MLSAARPHRKKSKPVLLLLFSRHQIFHCCFRSFSSCIAHQDHKRKIMKKQNEEEEYFRWATATVVAASVCDECCCLKWSTVVREKCSAICFLRLRAPLAGEKSFARKKQHVRIKSRWRSAVRHQLYTLARDKNIAKEMNKFCVVSWWNLNKRGLRLWELESLVQSRKERREAVEH